MVEGWSSHDVVSGLLGLVEVGVCVGFVISCLIGHGLKLGDSVSDNGGLVLSYLAGKVVDVGETGVELRW